MNWITQRLEKLPEAQRRPARAAASIAIVISALIAGLLAGAVFHYVLYRVGLPSRPFIYVAF